VETFLPPGSIVTVWYREAREEYNGNWVVDPYANLGWIDWIDGGVSTAFDGRVRVWSRVKNWSENRNRVIRVRAYRQQP